MVDYAPALKKLLKENGCWFDRQGKGDHEIWYSPHTNRKFPSTAGLSHGTPRTVF
jgi:hypothetical protein